MGFPPKLIACDAVLFSSFVGLLAVVSGAPVEPSELEPSKPAEFAEQVAAAAPEVPAAFLQAEPRATDELPCDLPTIIGDYAGAPPNRVPSRSVRCPAAWTAAAAHTILKRGQIARGQGAHHVRSLGTGQTGRLPQD